MSNSQWYKKLNTKVDVGLAIGITQQHKVQVEYVAQENHTLTFAVLSAEQKQAVCEDAEERYISYTFLRQSRAQHGNLKVDIRNNFTTCSNRYPKTHQQILHLLDKYSKTGTSLTSTARQLLCQRWLHLKDRHLLKRVVEVAEAAKAKVLKLLKRNIERIKHASIVARRVIHHQAAPKRQLPMTTTAPALRKASRSLPKTPRTWRKPSPNFRRQLDKTPTCLVRRRGFALSVWRSIPVHANEGETDGNQIWTTNWPSPGGIDFQIQPQHETKKQWQNHGSEKTSNHAGIPYACVV